MADDIGTSADRRLVGVYLNDHLAGSVAGSERFERLADILTGTPVGEPLRRVAREVAEEREILRGVVEELDLTWQNPVKQALAWVAERAARLKATRGTVRRSTTRTLLEVEVLRAALVGKLGGWQTLAEIADQLDLPRERFVDLCRRTEDQVRTMDDVHVFVRSRALTTRR